MKESNERNYLSTNNIFEDYFRLTMCFIYKYFRHLPPLLKTNRSVLFTVLGDTN